MDFEIQEQTVPLVSPDYTLERNKPMPSFNHGTIQANLIMELAIFRNNFRITSETSLDLGKWPSVPDIAIFPKTKMDLWNDETSVKQPPLCAIEILSPSQSLNELTTKAKEYFEHGVQSCWIVLPSVANIYVYYSPAEYDIFRSTETLVDKKLDVSFPLVEVFK
ncbi:MAG: Uma2 family endonuclease [Saprospiraceae bacterium]|nr:Uma2 family endonuclease [Saprospiraceae bacterium]